MKTPELVLFLMFLSFSGFTQEEEYRHHCYFRENSVTVGLGAAYSLDLELTGINSRIYYNVGEVICFGPEISFFKNNGLEVLDLNVVGHYIFETRWFGIYPLIGANYTSETAHSETEEAFGVIYGAGFHRNFGRWTTFVEYSRVESDLTDQFVTLGLMHNIRWK